MRRHIIPIVVLITGLSFIGQYFNSPLHPHWGLLILGSVLTLVALSHFTQGPIGRPVFMLFRTLLLGLFKVLARCLSLIMHPVTGARLMPVWQRASLFNRRNRGFLLDGRHARLSKKISFESMVTVGGMGRGKSSSFVMPNLYTLDDCSMVVTDTSGEIYEQTSGYLAAKGFQIKVLNLMDTNRSIGYNPLANAKTFTDVQKIANLIIRSANPVDRGEAIWLQGAEKFVRIIIQCLINRKDKSMSNLPNVKYLLNNFDAHLGVKESLIDQFIIESTLEDPATYNDYKGLILGNDRTTASFLSSADAALTAVGNPDIARLLSESTFDFKELRNRKTVLYVMVRQQDIELYGFVLNLFFTDLMNSLLQERSKGLPVYMLLDEFGHLTIPNFAVFATTARKYNVGFWLFLQSLTQLEARYGTKDARTILDGIQSELYMSGVSLDLAKEISERIGSRKIPTQQHGGQIYNREERMFDPSDIVRMKTNEALYFYSNAAPAKLKLKPFFKQKRFKKLAEITPVDLPRLKIKSPKLVNLRGATAKSDHVNDD